jgi:LmbE family N-acetylglucosaminyl deacetylase
VIRLGSAVRSVVVLGAHCDDIAIGAGGTLLTLCETNPGVKVDALVLSGGGTDRADEERAALRAFCPGAELDVTVHKLPDGRLPAHWDEAKDALEELRRHTDPDVILAPRTEDAHQDHRGLAKLVPTAYRDTSCSATRSSSGTGTSAGPTPTSPSPTSVPRKKSHCCNSTTRRSDTVLGTTRRPSSGWRGSVASNARRVTRKPSS